MAESPSFTLNCNSQTSHIHTEYRSFGQKKLVKDVLKNCNENVDLELCESPSFRFDLAGTSGGWQRSSRRKKKCNQCNDCAPPPTNTIHRFRKDFRAMTNTSYKKTWPISPHNNELTSLKECPFNFNLEFQTRPVLIPCSMMSHHIHSVPLGIFIPSDFPHILVDILQQLGETRQKRSSPIMTQCRPASRNATGLLQHRDRVRVALRHKKFLFSSCLGRNIFVLFRS